jgi:hypothetical protein
MATTINDRTLLLSLFWGEGSHESRQRKLIVRHDHAAQPGWTGDLTDHHCQQVLALKKMDDGCVSE